MTAKLCTIRGQGHLHERLNLTQEQFALRFGFSVAMPRYWERLDLSPNVA
jgi:DNA-binding transcriptional regulator YiaG